MLQDNKAVVLFAPSVQASAIILPTSKTSPQPLRLSRCVFVDRSNVTCFWDPGDVPAKTYTLKVKRTNDW